MVDSRWLDLTAAAAYLSLRPDVFMRKVKAGTIPAPSSHLGERTLRWDRGALDAAMEGKAVSADPRDIARDDVNALAAKIAGGAALPKRTSASE
jgi:predicted DNA-binding transcriptional regulator AlpA